MVNLFKTLPISLSPNRLLSKLYSEKLNQQNDNYHNSLKEFLNNNEIPKLNNGEKTFCDKPICETDILKRIKNLPLLKQNSWF